MNTPHRKTLHLDNAIEGGFGPHALSRKPAGQNFSHNRERRSGALYAAAVVTAGLLALGASIDYIGKVHAGREDLQQAQQGLTFAPDRLAYDIHKAEQHK